MASTFPDVAAVTAVLTNAGQTVGSIDVDTPLAAVIAAWSTMTGWNPFLLASSSTRYYDAPRDGYLELPGYGAITAVATGVTWGSNGVPTAGTARVANYDYFARRWWEGDSASPITVLKAARCGCWGYGEQSIAVTGTLGWPSIPDDVYKAILDETVDITTESTQAAKSKGLKQKTIGGRTVIYQEGGGAVLTGASKRFQATAKRYMRAVVA